MISVQLPPNAAVEVLEADRGSRSDGCHGAKLLAREPKVPPRDSRAGSESKSLLLTVHQTTVARCLVNASASKGSARWPLVVSTSGRTESLMTPPKEETNVLTCCT